MLEEALSATAPIKVLGRYALYGEIASGGMATVHVGRLVGPVGFSRTVAIKRLHPQYAKDPEFVSMFLDEARLAARIRHPNVVPTLDIVATGGELALVMEYVQGDSLSRLIRGAAELGAPMPIRVVASILSGLLSGLHAAHEAKNERGEPLGIVHRDISPQNVLVGVDGTTRVVDFGVAKAAGRIQTTRDGQVKGKLSYMAPEQLQGKVTRQTDIFASGVVLWEAITGRRLFTAKHEGETVYNVLHMEIPKPSAIVRGIPPGLDQIVLKGLERDPEKRFRTAREMAMAIEKLIPLASANEVGEWVERVAAKALAERAELIAEVESVSSSINSLNQLREALPVARRASEPEPEQTRLERTRPREGNSEVSSISLARSEMGLPSPKRNRALLWGVGVGATAIALFLLAFGVTRGARRAQGSAQHTPPPVLQEIPIPSPPSEVKPPPTGPAENAATDRVERPSTQVATPLSASPPHAAPRQPQPAIKATAPSPTPAKAKPNCDVPYSIDAAGHKKWKPECL